MSFSPTMPVWLFAAIAFLLLCVFGFGRKRRRDASLAAAQPEEPWLRKAAWASGRIPDSSNKTMWGHIMFALVWNMLSAPLGFNIPEMRGELGDGMAFVLLVAFPGTGLALAVMAIVAVMRQRKYGRSVFEMASVPGVIGGQLAGVIHTTAKVRPEDGFRIKLSCIHCVPSHGKNSGISRNLLWSDEQTIGRELLQDDAEHSAIPVLFAIPYECRPTDAGDEANSRSTTCWELEVTAKTPGLDYHATFEAPVFKTAESSPEFVLDRSLIAKYVARENPERDLREAGVIQETSPTGDGQRFIFPMARQPGMAAMLTLMVIIFSGVPFVLLYMEWGWGLLCFSVPFVLVGLLLLAMAMDVWFYRSVVDVSRRGLTVTGGLFGRGRSQWVDVAEIRQILTTRTMSSGSTVYFDLIIVCNDGKRITAGKRLCGKSAAATVVRLIEQALEKTA
jgi:hypothetical protein